MQPDRVLIFVYNLDKGNVSDIKDHMYSAAPAKTPACNLCSLISSPIGMKKAWKRFVADLGIPVQYLFREEFSKTFGLAKFNPPGAFIQMGGSLILIAGADEINQCGSTDELIELVNQKVRKYIS
jgi:hypothetical protein